MEIAVKLSKKHNAVNKYKNNLLSKIIDDLIFPQYMAKQPVKQQFLQMTVRAAIKQPSVKEFRHKTIACHIML
ncbi:hypothetical protein [Ruminococcus sp. XPD3002]|jgi:hypothetical protein|uniref:hypothetical protein n=1 Tax=Ruminococcus sp. XPD3002 TaxID=1452269 RepID=UPI00094D5681